MAQLVVRNLNEEFEQRLKLWAAASNRSAEEEHRQILQAAFTGPRRRSPAEVLRTIPNVGTDADFKQV